MENKYKFSLAWSDEDEGYIATCPEFVGLSAFGETPEEALAEAKVALKLFIETFQEQGLLLPEPQTVQKHSGQIRLRLPKSLHTRASQLAAEDGISLNQYIMLAVEARTSGQKVSSGYSMNWNRKPSSLTNQEKVNVEVEEIFPKAEIQAIRETQDEEYAANVVTRKRQMTQELKKKKLNESKPPKWTEIG